MSNIGGADRDITGRLTTVTIGSAIEVDGLIVGPNMVRHYRSRIAELEEALEKIASCEKRCDGDVVDIARKALGR